MSRIWKGLSRKGMQPLSTDKNIIVQDTGDESPARKRPMVTLRAATIDLDRLSPNHTRTGSSDAAPPHLRSHSLDVPSDDDSMRIRGFHRRKSSSVSLEVPRTKTGSQEYSGSGSSSRLSPACSSRGTSPMGSGSSSRMSPLGSGRSQRRRSRAAVFIKPEHMADRKSMAGDSSIMAGMIANLRAVLSDDVRVSSDAVCLDEALLESEAPEDKAVRGKRLRMIAQEFITTEETYVASLKTLWEDFSMQLSLHARQGAFQDMKKGTSDIVHDMFGNIYELYGIHSVMLLKLLDIDTEDSFKFVEMVLSILACTVDHFKAYHAYIGDFREHKVAIAMLQKSKSFTDVLEMLELKNGDLNSLMIQPIQRLPRYLLLIREVLRKTFPQEKHFAIAYAAISDLQEITTGLNNMGIQLDNLVELESLQAKLSKDGVNIDIFEDSRMLLYKCRVSLLNPDKQKRLLSSNIEKKLLYLFTDAVLITDSKYVVTAWFALECVLEFVKEDPDKQNVTMVVAFDNSQYLDEDFTFVFQDEKEETELIDRISEAKVRRVFSQERKKSR